MAVPKIFMGYEKADDSIVKYYEAYESGMLGAETTTIQPHYTTAQYISMV